MYLNVSEMEAVKEPKENPDYTEYMLRHLVYLFIFFFGPLLFFFFCYKTYEAPSSISHNCEIHAIMFILPRRREKILLFFLSDPSMNGGMERLALWFLRGGLGQGAL